HDPNNRVLRFVILFVESKGDTGAGLNDFFKLKARSRVNQSQRTPMGSISSMEVNVDVLEQMDLMDISDQEALDVFLNSGSGADEGALASPLPGAPRSRKSSTSSISSDTSVGGVDTPVIQSDDEEVHADTLLLTSAPNTRDEETEEEDEEGRCLVSKSS
uniref:Uncharacterized protein n=1 Tax=Mola mola TaxID=94237 RepID=A0A3Q3XHQ9_MOLML